MYCKKILAFIIFVFLTFNTSNAQNPPVFGTPGSDTVIVNSGVGYIILSNVGDGDSTKQQLNFEVVSSDVAVLSIDSISYSSGDKMALIWVSEKGILGRVGVTVAVTDDDGTTTKSFKVVVSNYTNHGIKFEIHDAIFWQEVVPLEDTPVFDSIVQSTNMKAAYDNLNWGGIPLTVSAGCTSATLCDGHDFSTGFMKGFLVPKTTGSYTFYINGDSDYALFLSADEHFENAAVIAAKSDKHGKVGTLVNGRKSAPVNLEAGKVYAIYAVQWNVHTENGGVWWELQASFAREPIRGEFLYPEYDVERPEKVENVKVVSLGDKFMEISWDKSSDNQKVKGYNVYVNGLKVNETAVSTTGYFIGSLMPSTNYSVVVTAVDMVANESFTSKIINAKTFALDTIPPTPPTNLSVDVATGLALKISWTGATDSETGIYGYNIYLGGELYKPEIIHSNSAIIKVLDPLTTYNIEVVAIDAGKNISEKSDVFEVSTTEFDPLNENLGLKTGRFEFSAEAISTTEGLGINTNFKNGEFLNSVHQTLLKDFQPGIVRWGALTANPMSFKDYTGAGKKVTIGQFITTCNNLDAYTAFCCGVENSTDWIKNPDTFIRFLEYINGPDDTPGGQLRVEEGYSAPFLKNSKGLIFEFGNEVWGADAHNAQIGKNYDAYAEWCRTIATKMRASAYFDSTKIVLVYSARYPARGVSYGLNDKIIDGDKGEVDWIAPSGYLGGNLNYDPALPPAETELEYYENIRKRADVFLTGMVDSHKFEVAKTGRAMKQYMYESNTTTPTYNGRLGQALLSTDYYLTAMELGSAIPTIFHLTGGEWRITEAENNYRRLPLFLTAKYFNRLCKGDVLDNKYYPNETAVSGTGAPFSKRPVGAHAYRNENGYTVVFVSRDYTNDHFVELDLPGGLSYKTPGKLFSITGPDFNTKNAVVDSVEVAVSDKMIVKVPNHGMVFLHFVSDSIKMTNLPLAHYVYPRIETVQLIAPKTHFTKPNERLAFRAIYSPSEAWDKEIEWSLLNNSGNFSINIVGSFCYVSSGASLENQVDSLVLKASNRSGDVSARVVLHLPKTAVSSTEVGEIPGIDIFPNPAKNSINIEIEKKQTLKIYSMSGTVLFEKQLNAGKNEIDIEHFARGYYLFWVGGKTETVFVLG